GLPGVHPGPVRQGGALGGAQPLEGRRPGHGAADGPVLPQPAGPAPRALGRTAEGRGAGRGRAVAPQPVEGRGVGRARGGRARRARPPGAAAWFVRGASRWTWEPGRSTTRDSGPASSSSATRIEGPITGHIAQLGPSRVANRAGLAAYPTSDRPAAEDAHHR